MREAVGLAFVAALQHLPPLQRACWCCATCSASARRRSRTCSRRSEAAVKGALQRARATLKTRLPSGGRERAPLPRSARERELVGRFADAVESGDVDGVVSLLTDDAWLTMPPQPFEYQGHAAIAALPPRPRRPARRSPPARSHAGQRSARLRLLPAGPGGGDRPPVRADGAHARRRPDLRHHLVRRQRRLPQFRAPADASQSEANEGRDPNRRGPRMGSRCLRPGQAEPGSGTSSPISRLTAAVASGRSRASFCPTSVSGPRLADRAKRLARYRLGSDRDRVPRADVLVLP